MAKLIIRKSPKGRLPFYRRESEFHLNYLPLEGLNDGKQHIFQIPAGEHTLTIGGGDYTDSTFPYEISIKAQETKYLEYQYNSNFVITFWGLQFISLFLAISVFFDNRIVTNVGLVIMILIGIPAILYMMWLSIARGDKQIQFQEVDKF